MVALSQLPTTTITRRSFAATPDGSATVFATAWLFHVVVAPTATFVIGPRTVKFVADVAVLVPSDTTTACGPVPTDGIVKATVEVPFAPVVPPLVIVALA